MREKQVNHASAIAGPVKRPTIRDVARLAGVSIATVSNALAERGNVTPRLVERVSEAVKTLGFVKESSASRLRSRQSLVVGIMVPDLTNPIFARLATVLENLARRDGYDLIITSSNMDPGVEAERLRSLVAWNPAGLFVVPCDNHFTAREIANRAGVPTVIIDRRPEGSTLDLVQLDNAGSAALGIEHLAGLGHRAILVMAPARGASSVVDRIEGCRRAARELPGTEIEVLEVESDQAREGLERRLAIEPLPDALFTANINMTLAALGALASRGLRVPEDISVIGFDDYAWLAALSPPLTVIRQPLAEIAALAWDRLMARVRNAEITEPPASPRGSLQIRGSTGPAARRAQAAQ